MSKQVNIDYHTLTLMVSTRLVKDNKISKVKVTCKGETPITFYRYPEQAFNDLEFLKNIRFCGYTLSDLLIIAELLKDHDIDDLTLKNYTDGISDGYAIAQKHFEESIRESINRTLEGLRGLG